MTTIRELGVWLNYEKNGHYLVSVPLLPFTGTVFSETIAKWLSQAIIDLITNNCKWDSFERKMP